MDLTHNNPTVDRATVKVLAHGLRTRGRPRTRFNDDPFAGIGYWPKQVIFFLYHALELASPGQRERLRREFLLLREHEYCRCGREFEAEPAPRTGSSIHGWRPPTTPLLLDLHRAYAAMPLHWEARTEVYLLLVQGLHPNTVANMRRNGEFVQAHRKRLAAETVARTTMRGGLTGPVVHTLHPDGAMTWRGTLGSTLAYWLNGSRAEQMERAA